MAIGELEVQIPQREAVERAMLDAQSAAEEPITPLLVRETRLEVYRVAETLRPVSSERLDIRQDD